MAQSQTVSYIVRASEHAGNDLVLWLRYLSKWVNPSGHIFSDRDIAQIQGEEQISSMKKTVLAEAIKPGTPTNTYVIKLRQPYDNSKILEMIERLKAGEDS